MYKIIGTDGKQYGPISAGEIRRWISENRVERQTPVFAEGAKDWNFLGLLPEFAGFFPGGATVTPPLIAPPGHPRKTNSLATTGLIFGILSWTCCCGFPFNLVGLICSLVALSQINANQQSQEGRGVAIAGVALSGANLIVGFGVILLELALAPLNMAWNFKTF